MWAMFGAGVLSAWEDAANLIRIEKTVKPVADQENIYNHFYAVYRDLYTALEPCFDQVALARKEIGS